MKTVYKIPKIVFLFLLINAVLSCDSFVEIDPPKSQLINITVFKDFATAEAALTDIYSNIRDKGMLTGNGYGLSNQLGCYADEIVSMQNPNNPSLNFFNNALLPSNTAVAGYWNNSYNQIYAANSIIEGSASSTNISDEQKKKLEGEALFIRGLLHFYLVNIFGDIPYITQTDYKKNSTASRTASQNVYENIINDLEKAIILLAPDNLDTEKVRSSQWAVKALLSRVYLYNKSYPEAANMASSVLNQQQFSLEDIDLVFLISSKETIWQLQSGESGRNTAEASFFTFTSGPPPLVSLSDDLVNSFDSDDLRRISWVKTVTDGTSSWYHVYKYKENNSTPVSKEYSVVFRLAELYLIRAEARAMQGEIIGAKEDVNKIRHRAGLGDITAQTKQEILSAVLKERRSEFFTEYGQRFFDLKRLGILDSTLNGVKTGWDTTDNLFPLPQTELSTNPNLRPQNPGY